MVTDMRVLILCLAACIVPKPNDHETGLEPDVDTDGDSDSDSDGDADTDTATKTDEPWNASAISFDFSGAIIGGEIRDGAILSGKRHDATFGLSLMSTVDDGLRNCNVQYHVGGAPTSVEHDYFDSDYWRSWDFSSLDIEEAGDDCASLYSVFRLRLEDHSGTLEALLDYLHIQMGLKDMSVVPDYITNEWSKHWSFGDWNTDEPYLAAGGLYIGQPFAAAYEMNVFQGYAIDPKTMEVLGDGFDLIPLEMKGAEDVPDGFYTSSPMFVIGTDW
jgi:hypothetical protein